MACLKAQHIHRGGLALEDPWGGSSPPTVTSDPMHGSSCEACELISPRRRTCVAVGFLISEDSFKIEKNVCYFLADL